MPGGAGVVAAWYRGGAEVVQGVSLARYRGVGAVLRAHVCYGGTCTMGTRVLRVEVRYWIRVTNWTLPVLSGPT